MVNGTDRIAERSSPSLLNDYSHNHLHLSTTTLNFVLVSLLVM
ncbi:hypothetical protein E2C01_078201 [Portunus trituberculatus]|uniref:Uncharacterized protein n=1 Tax=Portunus trituberculatus TaxID=210409 RepID=A0A5B7IN79_PORTR|nr:hypothetical protein [Portunus trituberculatus]